MALQPAWSRADPLSPIAIRPVFEYKYEVLKIFVKRCQLIASFIWTNWLVCHQLFNVSFRCDVVAILLCWYLIPHQNMHGRSIPNCSFKREGWGSKAKKTLPLIISKKVEEYPRSTINDQRWKNLWNNLRLRNKVEGWNRNRSRD